MRRREEYLTTKRWTRLVMAATGLDPMDAEKIVKELPARILKKPLCEPFHDWGFKGKGTYVQLSEKQISDGQRMALGDGGVQY